MPRAIDGMKVCTLCKRNLPVVEYYPNHHTFDGLRSECRDCLAERRGHKRCRTPEELHDALVAAGAKAGAIHSIHDGYADNMKPKRARVTNKLNMARWLLTHKDILPPGPINLDQIYKEYYNGQATIFAGSLPAGNSDLS